MYIHGTTGALVWLGYTGVKVGTDISIHTYTYAHIYTVPYDMHIHIIYIRGI